MRIRADISSIALPLLCGVLASGAAVIISASLAAYFAVPV